MTVAPAVEAFFAAPRPRDPPQPLAAGVLMLAGGALALTLGSFGLYLIPFCLAFSWGPASSGCLAFSLLIALPGFVGVVAVTSGILLLVRSGSHRLVGGVVCGVSGAAIVLGVIWLAQYPTTLLFVLLAFGWPIVVVFIGGLFALAWRPPAHA